MVKRLNAIVPDEMHKTLRVALAKDGVEFTSWLQENITSYLNRKTLEEERTERMERKKELKSASYRELRSEFERMVEDPAPFILAEANIILKGVRGSEDIMPSSLCGALELSPGSPYVDGVRKFSKDMKAGRIMFNAEKAPKGTPRKRKEV